MEYDIDNLPGLPATGTSTEPTQAQPTAQPVATKLDMISPTGERWTIPAEHHDAAIRKGFRLETQEETKRFENEKLYGEGILNPVVAGVESALGTATLGLSDIAIQKSGLDPHLTERREVNPIASGIGAGIGLLAPVAGEAGLLR